MTKTIRVGWLDPSLNSRNTGDQIIADAVHRELRETLRDTEIVRLPTQTFLRPSERVLARSCNKFIVGGTNLLNGNIPRYIQWRLDPGSYGTYKRRVSTMGVGWWQYQSAANGVSRHIWKNVLGSGANSVRDTYTANRLAEFGVASINTSCPTVWKLPEYTSAQALAPSSVLMTITDYHKNPKRDLRLIRGLRDRYREVLVWPQGSQDRDYLTSLDSQIKFIGPELSDFDAALNGGSVDYVGTRLHAGIRALQFGVKSTILAIDNRATEISRDIGISIMSNDLNDVDWEQVDRREPGKLAIPHVAIGQWRKNLSAWVLE
ncbi:polysaccharide pyruvyl transferase family protein [Pseudarthrobacter sp. H2]|uniref:polysaccharide pyruvyl transferase family protein n=1 Tax=Pseudarthrobacter sp. H2 TaxID=3418415 RepID=UPI003CE83884